MVSVRVEQPSDVESIVGLVKTAFASAIYSSGTEHFIVNALRDKGALSLSLVAESQGELLGHIAVSSVSIPHVTDWYGLGPVSVLPDCHGQGVGSLLTRTVLEMMQARGAQGCIVVGDPHYYQRFGFRVIDGLQMPEMPKEYFNAVCLNATQYPQGDVACDPVFFAEYDR